jgi:thiol-disulfide isomerase/thioredoxin
MARRRPVLPVPGVALVGAALACLLPLAGCSSLGSTGDKGYISGDGAVQVVDEGDRGAAIELTGESLTGDPVDVADYRGKVVVVNTWWSGCAPCRSEMPMLAKASRRLGSEAQFLGINIRDASQSQGLAFSRGAGVEYPSIFDPNGKAMLAFSGKASLVSTPSTVVLDPEGRVAAVITGEIPSELTLTDVVDDVAGTSADG